MFKDTSYKLAFIYAFLVHVSLIMFLLVKSNHLAKQVALQNVNIVHAVAINLQNIDNHISRSHPQALSSPVTEPKVVSEPKPEPLPPPKLKNLLEPQESLKVEKKFDLPDLVQKKTAVANHQSKIQAQKKRESLRQANEALSKRLLAEELAESKLLKDKIKKEKNAKYAAKRQQIVEQLTKNQLASEIRELSSAAAHGQQISGEVNKYKAMLIQAISSQWIVPEGVEKGASCVLLVEIAPGGMVLKVNLLSSSGNELLDRSAQKAVLKASPLPVPEDPALFDEFRSLKLTVRPEGIV
jgi:colicin import membrane protein